MGEREKSDYEKYVNNWAGQTIIFALGARGHDTGVHMKIEDQTSSMKVVLDGLIREVNAGAKPGTPETVIGLEVAHRVIDWCSDYMAGYANERDDRIRHMRNWGRQTLATAASIRAESIGKPIDSQKRSLSAGNEFQKTGIELWEAATKECKQPVQLPEQIMRFSRKVMGWCVKHLEGCKF